jgi:preprotein translocase subunit YajC
MDSNLTLVALYIVIGGVFYFIWYRPQQQQRKKTTEMLTALAPGDRVMTAGGLLGTIRAIDGDIFDVEVAKGVVVKFTKRAIIQRVTEDDASTDE